MYAVGECEADSYIKATVVTRMKGNYMKRLHLSVQNFLQDEGGATSIEYALIASLIAVVIMTAVASLGTQVCELFRSVAEVLGATGVPACA